MRIPLKTSAKSVKSRNHPEFVGIIKVSVEIIIVFIISDFASYGTLSFFLLVYVFIYNFHYCVTSGDKEKIQSLSVLSEEITILLRNSKNYVSVIDIKAHSFGFDS